ncbi:ExbD/TolR family protein [uncultured Campylobacter sp.]|uniref:ExbD/TolR family protein n=1 Tax=uncultured Campylobacter sp. TaxID=218934 RepID=UPI0026364DD8|nr:ExbD/TolR family protein [uncultured Campylobacter sp.]
MLLDEKPELNITPLVDIMLVLLAILMVTAPSIVYDEKVNLPSGSQKSSSVATLKSLLITVNEKRQVFFDGKIFPLSSFPDNLALLKTKFNTDEPVFIRADKNLKYDDVMFVLKTVKNLGFTKAALQTE